MTVLDALSTSEKATLLQNYYTQSIRGGRRNCRCFCLKKLLLLNHKILEDSLIQRLRSQFWLWLLHLRRRRCLNDPRDWYLRWFWLLFLVHQIVLLRCWWHLLSGWLLRSLELCHQFWRKKQGRRWLLLAVPIPWVRLVRSVCSRYGLFGSISET